ncbi:bifunctional indole-3-glycerol-phosphate synthase TrpC/phosphoribosylanthranilate isomerase TrpF [Sphingomonas ginkgonis]|nr:bifunctional indole-3-glycerol-phosphate synthase TrpC/phosphoribosylanthranilate isomerase TrpF [Sphingomonas ginkgonis]
MANVLAEIVANKRREVAERLDDFDGSAAVPTTRSLRAALARPGARFIMEVKRASPSGHRGKHSIEDAARAYAPIADAVSVLIDRKYFHGSIGDLRAVRRLFDGPILAKDFVVDPRQVTEARLAGADAVLVMLSVLGDEEARVVLAEAALLGMDAIVEVHDEAEMARAAALGAAIIGINNRDLKTLRTDLVVTERLAALAPRDALLISESGIAERADIERLARHVDAFLVGSSLMAADDIAEAARSLVFGRVKICGLTRAVDVEAAALAGASHAGFIFVPDTPRHLTPAAAAGLVEQARDAGMKPVGVFRDCPPDEVVRTANELGLGAVQLHGSESPEQIAAVRCGLAPDVELWAAQDGDRLSASREGCDRTLFDSPGGGSGRSFDWSHLYDRQDLSHGFVAGGIGPDNAADAARLGAYGIDASSRLESAPGIKDHASIAAMMASLRTPTREQ